MLLRKEAIKTIETEPIRLKPMVDIKAKMPKEESLTKMLGNRERTFHNYRKKPNTSNTDLKSLKGPLANLMSA